MNENNYIYLPESDALISSGIVNAMRDRYWLVHKEKGLIFYKSKFHHGLREAHPQCNSNVKVVESLFKHHDKNMVEIKFIPLVLKPVNVEDYCN